MGSGFDFDRGGWVVAEVLENVHLCVTEKAGVINRSRYAEWWLMLVDRTGLGFDDDDYISLRKVTSFGYIFDRILMINPYEHNHSFDFYP
jgi:hypothetical protein